MSDAVVKDAESILSAGRDTAVSRTAKRAKAKQARAAAKRQRSPGGRTKRGKKR